jgi:hypothetical protein
METNPNKSSHLHCSANPTRKHDKNRRASVPKLPPTNIIVKILLEQTRKRQMRTAPCRCSSWLTKSSTTVLILAAALSATTPALFRRLFAPSRRKFSAVVGAAYLTTNPRRRAGSSGPSAGFCPSRSSSLGSLSFSPRIRIMATTSSSSDAAAAPTSAPTTTTTTTPWSPDDPAHAIEAREELQVWPLDTANAAYLQQVHPRGYTASTDTPHVRL